MAKQGTNAKFPGCPFQTHEVRRIVDMACDHVAGGRRAFNMMGDNMQRAIADATIIREWMEGVCVAGTSITITPDMWWATRSAFYAEFGIDEGEEVK